jgi:hypothetical protein
LIACTLLVMFSIVRSFRLIGAAVVAVGDIVNLVEETSTQKAVAQGVWADTIIDCWMQRTITCIYQLIPPSDLAFYA